MGLNVHHSLPPRRFVGLGSPITRGSITLAREPTDEPSAGAVRQAAIALGVLLLLSLLLPSWVHAQTEFSPARRNPDAATIAGLEQKVLSIDEDYRRLAGELRALKRELASGASRSVPAELPLEVPLYVPEPNGPQEPASWRPPTSFANSAPTPQARSSEAAGGRANGFGVTYDNGFVIVPENPNRTPFSLKINSQNMVRYDGFSRDAAFWTDSAGNQVPIFNTSSFQIPRGRLIFSGTAILPKLSYLLNIDYNTVNNNPIGFRAYELGYQFHRALGVYVGQTKVPGTREWLESGFAALEGPDRTMATTFFRPSLSQGIWLLGEPLPRLYYRTMVSNGFNTLNLRPVQLNNNFCWSGSSWWEPWGNFGSGYADFEAHATPVVRLGTSYTVSHGQGSQSASDAVENSSVRLSDGTLLTQTGAFAPGVTLTSYDISLAAIDLAFKYRGWSLSTEWFAQNLFALTGDGPLPIQSTQAYGGFLQGGYFVIPQRVELYSRASYVTGSFGSGSEVAGGLSWFIVPGKSNLRYTFDTAWLNHSPADQNRTGFVAGQTGVLFRTQIVMTY